MWTAFSFLEFTVSWWNYRIKYILRLSCVKTLARKHKSIAHTFLKRVDLEFFQEFFTEEGGFISLIFPRASFALQRLYSGRVWYLDIIFINGLSNHEWLVMRPWKWYLFLNEWRDNKKNSFISIMKCLCSKSRGWSTKYSTFLLESPLGNALSVKCIHRESHVQWKMQEWLGEGFLPTF